MYNDSHGRYFKNLCALINTVVDFGFSNAHQKLRDVICPHLRISCKYMVTETTINMEENAKKKVTDEERIALAEKLDKELDDFIAGLERKTYDDGWKEEDWKKEMDKHPFFMKDVPQDGEVSPLVEGLQQLKYSPEENTPQELAEAYKQDGNFNFKCKNYRMSIIGYSEGLKQNFFDSNLKAQLYNNRAAAHYQLKNFRSCYNDCKSALKLVPTYQKAKKRLAEACVQLGCFEECIEICDSILADSNDPDIRKMRTEAEKEKRVKERDKRRQQVLEKKLTLKKDRLRELVEERGVKFYPKPFWEINDPVIDHKVYIEDDKLVWPVIFLYPEYKMTDLIQHFNEDNTFNDHIKEVFIEPPEWDLEKKYVPNSIVIHYEDINGRIHRVKKSSTLRSVLSEPEVDGCTPAFILHSKESAAYDAFLKQYN